MEKSTSSKKRPITNPVVPTAQQHSAFGIVSSKPISEEEYVEYCKNQSISREKFFKNIDK